MNLFLFFFCVQNLKRISIRKSRLKYLNKLASPETLVQLDLSHNHNLTGVDWSLFRRMAKLTHLNLTYNGLFYIQPLDRVVMPNLMSLDLSGQSTEFTDRFV